MGTGNSNSSSISGTAGSNDDGFSSVCGYTTKLNNGAQGKHIPSHNNYDKNANKSIFKGSLKDAQELISKFAGTGKRISENKESVDFKKTIGVWINKNGNQRLKTTRGIIHYGRKGAHIVPAHPNEKR